MKGDSYVVPWNKTSHQCPDATKRSKGYCITGIGIEVDRKEIMKKGYSLKTWHREGKEAVYTVIRGERICTQQKKSCGGQAGNENEQMIKKYKPDRF